MSMYLHVAIHYLNKKGKDAESKNKKKKSTTKLEDEIGVVKKVFLGWLDDRGKV